MVPEKTAAEAAVRNSPTSKAFTPEVDLQAGESFGDMLSQYEKSHSRKKEDGRKQLVGTVILVTADSIFLDIGYKSEGILPLTALGPGESLKPGDKLPVSSKGRDPEGYYQLTRAKVERPADWAALEKAFAEKATIVGTVTGVIKGGLSVDVGVRAFMPASRSGARDAAEMEKMVEQEILCRIIKLDVCQRRCCGRSPRGRGRRRAFREGSPLLRNERRRHRERHGAQPYRLRRICRSRRRRRVTARQRYFMELASPSLPTFSPSASRSK